LTRIPSTAIDLTDLSITTEFLKSGSHSHFFKAM
jgi:hypothetical protein